VHCFAHILNLIVMVCSQLLHVCLFLTCYVLFPLEAILSPFVAKKAKNGRNGLPVGAVEDLELEELLEGNLDNNDDEDERGIEGQDTDRLEADEAMIEEIAEAPDHTIDVDAAKQDIRMGKLSMSKVRVRMQVIWRDAEHQN